MIMMLNCSPKFDSQLSTLLFTVEDMYIDPYVHPAQRNYPDAVVPHAVQDQRINT